MRILYTYFIVIEVVSMCFYLMYAIVI